MIRIDFYIFLIYKKKWEEWEIKQKMPQHSAEQVASVEEEMELTYFV